METLLAAANIQTRCPNCQTVFEIGEDIVQGEDPRVRCGECFTIFNAKDNMLVNELSDDLLVDGSASGEGTAPSTTEVDLNDDKIFFEADNSKDSDSSAGFSDMDLFSDHAVLPEVEYLHDNDEIPELDFDAIDPDGDQFDGTLFDDVDFNEEELSFEDTGVWSAETEETEEADHEVEADLGNDFETDYYAQTDTDGFKLEPDSIPEMDADVQDFDDDLYDSNLHTPEHSSGEGYWGGRVFLLLVLLIGLSALYLYSNWQSLQKTEPFSTINCYISDCAGVEAGDLGQLRVVRRNVYSHPKVDKALVINIVFRNNAEFEQAYPILGIQMSDIRGEAVAMRDFKPFEYLKKNITDEIPLIEAGQMVDVSLEVSDPGDDAKSFELEFK